jgi:hypothetical protein
MEGAMTELGRDAKSLVEAASGGDEPTAENRARVRAAIAATLVAAAAASGATTMAAAKGSAAAAGAAGSAIPGSVATALVSLALVSALGVGTAMYVRSSTPANKTVPSMATRAVALATRAPPHSPARAATISAPAEAAPLPAERAVGEKRLPVSTPPSAAVPARTRVSGTSVEAEMLLIGQAREALQSGHAAHALVVLYEHGHRFPSGALGEERDAMRVTSLCALGRVAEASAAASQFLRAFPDSPHAGRVRASCASDSDSTF